MKKPVYALLVALVSTALLSACAVTPAITHRYQLEAFSSKPLAKKTARCSLRVNAPEAAAGYHTEQMLYADKRYALTAFAHNAWVDPPADMLLPLIQQSLIHSRAFKAVASSTAAELTDYQLDTQLITLKQDFLTHPSQMIVTIKVILSRTADNTALASRLFTLHTPCPTDTPYGGVIAANQAMRQFTQALTQFVVQTVSRVSC